MKIWLMYMLLSTHLKHVPLQVVQLGKASSFETVVKSDSNYVMNLGHLTEL